MISLSLFTSNFCRDDNKKFRRQMIKIAYGTSYLRKSHYVKWKCPRVVGRALQIYTVTCKVQGESASTIFGLTRSWIRNVVHRD